MDDPNLVARTEVSSPPEKERFWPAGRLEAMPIRKLPDAPPSIHLLGPTVFLVALGVGMGESYMWPRLVLVFGPDIRWLFLVGVTLQAVVMLEMARYAMATGESIFFGAARVFKPIMWFFFVVAILVYIWPGHLSAGAAALEKITGIPWTVSACVGLILVGILFSLAKVIYNLLENLLSILIGGLAALIKATGGLAWLAQVIATFARGHTGRRSGELSIAALAAGSDALTANNTVAILVTGSLAKDIAQRHGISPRRAASVLDIFACIVQGVLPYGAQILLAASLAAVSPLALAGSVQYCWLLAVSALVFMLWPSRRPVQATE